MKYKKMKIDEYLSILSSEKPMPGGGVNCALIGASGVALAIKVINLSINKEKFKKYKKKLLNIKDNLIEIKDIFLELMNKDSDSFKKMESVFKIKVKTEFDKKLKEEMYEDACKWCIEPPYELILLSKKSILLIDKLYGITTKLAISDLNISKMVLISVIETSKENVKINLPGIKNKRLINKYKKIL